MIDPFEYPDEVLWELSDPDFNYDMHSEDAHQKGQKGIYEVLSGEDEDIEIKGPLGLTDIGQYNDTEYHDLMKQYQKKLAEINEQEIPTKSEIVYWIYANSKKKYKKSTKHSGKWLLFIPEKFIDDAWEQVKDATTRGLLGGSSKCSTLKGQKSKGSDYVICVYTYNWKDEEDVMRIRAALRDLGFIKTIPYKTDKDTLKKKYYKEGEKRISKYYE